MKLIFTIFGLVLSCTMLNAQELAKVEYFIDGDPGSGNAVFEPVTGIDTGNLTLIINTTNLPHGLHSFSARSIDDSSDVSLTATTYFVKINFPVDSINRVEYFIDGDPGIGNATPVALSSTIDTSFSFSINTTALLSGLHALYVRSITQMGQSSFSEVFYFIKNPIVSKNFEKGEYFFDSDPGFDMATSFNLSGTNAVNKIIPISIPNLSSGMHSLFVRTKDNYDWSATSSYQFVKIPSSSTTLQSGEYFFDSDPGFDQAFPFAVTGDNVQNQVIPITVNNLTSGMHYLFVRTRDDLGWSRTAAYPFVKVETNVESYLQCEYFIDVDPGVGDAHTVGFGATNLTAITVPINTTDLSLGAHTLFVRSQDGDGRWSLTASINFFKIVVQNEFGRLEYYFDQDPGYGLGTIIPLEGIDTTGLVFQANTAALSSGLHTLSVRSQSEVGSWSLNQTIIFVKIPVKSQKMVRGEYFFNDVLSPGNGNSFELFSADTTVIFSPNIAGLDNGLNYLFYRSLDDNGNWSQLVVKPFFKHPDGNVHLIKIEYFMNADPGFNNASVISLPPVTDTLGLTMNVDISGLTFGYHKFSVRAFDSKNNWSLTRTIEFAKYCQDSIILIDVFVPDSFYQAATNIRSNETMNPVSTTFKSTEIDLLPGFEVPLGVLFTTESGICPTKPASAGLNSGGQNSVDRTVLCDCPETNCICNENQSLIKTIIPKRVKQ